MLNSNVGNATYPKPNVSAMRTAPLLMMLLEKPAIGISIPVQTIAMMMKRNMRYVIQRVMEVKPVL
jgi:hypothetical protein